MALLFENLTTEPSPREIERVHVLKQVGIMIGVDQLYTMYNIKIVRRSRDAFLL